MRTRRRRAPVVPARAPQAPEPAPVCRPRGNRSLSALMFVDIVGYTRLTAENEARARRLRVRFRRSVEGSVERHVGEVVQHYGDGALCVFQSAVEAVRAAADIQRMLGGRNGIPVRVGLHVADVVRESDGLFGDGVNVAARVEALAAPGEVLMSAAVARELQNHPDFKCRSLGRFRLKNVPEPMEVAVLEGVGGAALARSGVWSRGLMAMMQRHSSKIRTTLTILGSAAVIEMADMLTLMPEWIAHSAALVLLVEWLGPVRGVRAPMG